MNDVITQTYAGLDVSLKTVANCVLDTENRVPWRGEVANEPAVVAGALGRHAPGLSD